MINFAAPIELGFVFQTIGIIFGVIGICVYAVNQRTKKIRLREKKS